MRQRAVDKYGGFLAENVFVIGDTPHDIACGKAIGAGTIAIATGQYSARDLLGCGADHVFDDLSKIETFFSALGLESQRAGGEGFLGKESGPAAE